MSVLGPGIHVEGMDYALAALDKYLPAEMKKTSQRATMAGAKVAAKLIRQASPTGKTKNLRKSVRARRGRSGYAAAIAGPTAPHRHLVIRSHRIVTVSGIDTGRTTRANPFVDRSVEAGRDLIFEAVRRELYGKG